jgi:hypothetical protein
MAGAEKRGFGEREHTLNGEGIFYEKIPKPNFDQILTRYRRIGPESTRKADHLALQITATTEKQEGGGDPLRSTIVDS